MFTSYVSLPEGMYFGAVFYVLWIYRKLDMCSWKGEYAEPFWCGKPNNKQSAEGFLYANL